MSSLDKAGDFISNMLIKGFNHETPVNKKKRPAPDDKLARSRERNRMHARKTRERKKIQMNALHERIEYLHTQSKSLRLMIDERYTARLLIGLSQSSNDDSCSDKAGPRSSSMLCGDSYSATSDWFKDEATLPTQKRVRRPGKYTQIERETFRRERNRMHAKRTRDRKKMFFEISEKIIVNMERETKILRDYLVSINVITADQAQESEDHDRQCRQSLALLKRESGDDSDRSDIDDDDNCDEDEVLDGDDERIENSSNNGSVTGSWNGSNDGSNGSNDGSDNAGSGSGGSNYGSSGETSAESNSSGSNHEGSSTGSDKQDETEEADADHTDDDIQFQEQEPAEIGPTGNANFVNKSTLDAHNSKSFGFHSSQRSKFVTNML